MITENSSSRIDRALHELLPLESGLSRTRIQALIQDGSVKYDCGKIVKDASIRPTLGQSFVIDLPLPAKVDILPEDIDLEVIFEDNDVLVINKPVGMVVHPAPGNSSGTLVNALLHHCGGSLSGIGGVIRPGIVHRIDKDTSGLLIIAKNDNSHQFLSHQFASHCIDRQYQALVWGDPSSNNVRLRGIEGVSYEQEDTFKIIGNIARHRTNRKKMSVSKSGKYACTRFKIKETYGTETNPYASLIECWLETGRTHQIRVHMKLIGHSIIGDDVYGSRRMVGKAFKPAEARFVNNFRRQALHANKIGFIHPKTKKRHAYEVEMPLDMKNLVAALK